MLLVAVNVVFVKTEVVAAEVRFLESPTNVGVAEAFVEVRS
jgi:hypothetical protein